MKLTDHFSLEEFTVSDTAVRIGIDNTPTPEVLENLKRLAAGLEQVRTVLGSPIHITSGYRSPQLNQRVGGAKNSDHIRGLAADIICPEFGTPLEVCRAIAKAGLGVKQIIHEFGRWSHVSFPGDGEAAQNELLTIRSAAVGYELGLNQIT